MIYYYQSWNFVKKVADQSVQTKRSKNHTRSKRDRIISAWRNAQAQFESISNEDKIKFDLICSSSQFNYDETDDFMSRHKGPEDRVIHR